MVSVEISQIKLTSKYMLFASISVPVIATCKVLTDSDYIHPDFSLMIINRNWCEKASMTLHISVKPKTASYGRHPNRVHV